MIAPNDIGSAAPPHPTSIMLNTRRRFLATAAAAAGTRFVPGRPAAAAESQAGRRDGPLRLAVIGVANRGGANLDAVAGETIAAICDVDQNYLTAVSKRFPEATRHTDYRELLRSESELDGVVISTPDHHHAPAAMRAIAAGLNVYCEKPLAHTVAEVRAMTVAARAAGVVTQMGTQIHASENYRRVVELIRAKAIGEVHRVHVWVGKSWSAASMPQPAGNAPDFLDWDTWLGPAPGRDYTPGLHPAQWRRYRPYGAGTLGDMGCHYLDLPFWALGLRYPSRITADAPPADPLTCPLGLKVDYQFAANDQTGEIELSWYDGDRVPRELEGTPLPTSGVMFVGDRGTMIATYHRYELFPADQYVGFEPPPASIESSIGHHNEWLAAIRGLKESGTTATTNPPLCHFDYAGPLTETVLLGTVAHRAGRPLHWDGDQLKVIDDAEANGWLSKTSRDGWAT